MSIAIHGLPDTKDIISTVNHIFDDMNLRHISCVSVYRTPARPDMNHHGVVIAKLNSLSDKREVAYLNENVTFEPCLNTVMYS